VTGRDPMKELGISRVPTLYPVAYEPGAEKAKTG
jgi:hypothetical protein